MKALLSLALVILSATSSLAQDAPASTCPTITITGPAGIHTPWEAMTFRVDLKGEVPKGVTYNWDVTDGVIMGGQRTPELKARYLDASTFLATANIGGLPSGCPKKASESLSISGPHPIYHLGTINNFTYTIDKELLERIREALTWNEGSQLYIWLYAGSLSESKYPSLKSHLLRQLSATKIDPSRITLEVSAEKPRGAIFWRIPPGSSNPAP